jgi:hypothetical protein
MQDVIFIAIIVGFFLLALAYMSGCEALGKGAESK